MSVSRDLFHDNPLRLESGRKAKRFLMLGSQGAKPALVMGALAVLYLTVLGVFGWAVNGVGMGTAMGMSAFSLGAAFIIPILAFNWSIAGEREKRTWDILRVAPISETQIIIARFVLGARLVFLLWIATLPFYAVALAGRGRAWGEYESAHGHYVGVVLLATMLTLISGMLSLSITLFASSAVRRPLQALSLSFAIQFIWLLGIPTFLSTFVSSKFLDLVGFLTLNPIFAFASLSDAQSAHAWQTFDPDRLTIGLVCWGSCMAAYPLLIVLFLSLSRRALILVDREKPVFARRDLERSVLR